MSSDKKDENIKKAKEIKGAVNPKKLSDSSGNLDTPKKRIVPDATKTIIFEDLFSENTRQHKPEPHTAASPGQRKVIRTEITGNTAIPSKEAFHKEPIKSAHTDKAKDAANDKTSREAAVSDKDMAKPSDKAGKQEQKQKKKVVAKPLENPALAENEDNEIFKNESLFNDDAEDAVQLQFQTNPISIDIPQDTFTMKKIKAEPQKTSKQEKTDKKEPEKEKKPDIEEIEEPEENEFEDISRSSEAYDEEDDFLDEYDDDLDEYEDFEEYQDDTVKNLPQHKSDIRNRLIDWTYPPPPDRALTIKSVMPPKAGKFARAVFGWVGDFFVAGVAIALFFTFIFRVITVDGYSMLPNYDEGYRVLATDFAGDVQKGDVVIITNVPDGPIIKRVIAVEGQTVDLDPVNKAVVVDGSPIDDSEFGVENGITEAGFTDQVVINFPQVVPRGCIFVLGDNREASLDSRYEQVGMIDKRNVLGKVIFTIYPFERFGPAK